MSRRIDRATGGHMHLAWEKQPLIGHVARPRTRPGSMAMTMIATFLMGLLLGMLL